MKVRNKEGLRERTRRKDTAKDRKIEASEEIEEVARKKKGLWRFRT